MVAVEIEPRRTRTKHYAHLRIVPPLASLGLDCTPRVYLVFNKLGKCVVIAAHDSDARQMACEYLPEGTMEARRIGLAEPGSGPRVVCTEIKAARSRLLN